VRNVILRSFYKTSKAPFEIAIFIEAAIKMATLRTGALIVFEKEDNLNYYVQKGERLDAIASVRLLENIFFKDSPLHDGAMIISQQGLILAASCSLPPTQNVELALTLGHRHQAAVGITEVTDAIVLVVSEQTGAISLTKGGKIYKELKEATLRTKLLLYLFEDKELVKAEELKHENDNQNH
jgi:diadenylate cyclase